MLDRAREKFPDRTFADLGAEPQEGVADLDDAINEILEDLTSRQTTYDENNDKLVNLFGSDPAAAEFVQKWIETGDPRTALVEVFGDDLGMSEEAQAGFKDQLNSWRERKAANDALEAQAEANWQESLAAVIEWGNAKGLSQDQERDIMIRLLGITFNGMENKYGPEEFDMVWNAMNHDADVAAARAEGEVSGRNEKIAAARKGAAVASVLPPAGGGQGARTAERKPKGEGDIWDNLSS